MDYIRVKGDSPGEFLHITNAFSLIYVSLALNSFSAVMLAYLSLYKSQGWTN